MNSSLFDECWDLFGSSINWTRSACISFAWESDSAPLRSSNTSSLFLFICLSSMFVMTRTSQLRRSPTANESVTIRQQNVSISLGVTHMQRDKWSIKQFISIASLLITSVVENLINIHESEFCINELDNDQFLLPLAGFNSPVLWVRDTL